MKKGEIFGVVLLIILAVSLSVTQTIYWFEPVETHVGPDSSYYIRSILGGYIAEGESEYTEVSNRIQYFSRIYDWECWSYTVQSRYASTLIAEVFTRMVNGGDIHLSGEFTLNESLVMLSDVHFDGGNYTSTVTPGILIDSTVRNACVSNIVFEFNGTALEIIP